MHRGRPPFGSSIPGDSSYVRDADTEQMRALFPRARPVVVKGVGHWVHSEAPEVVTETLRRVLRLLTAG